MTTRAPAPAVEGHISDWRLIALLYFVGLFAAAQFAKIALTLEPLGAVYPDTSVPFAVSALSVAGILFGVTAGMIVALFGARKVLLAALFFAAALSLIQASMPAFPMFMALRIAEGFAHLAIVVAAPTLMAAVAAPKDVSVAMGLWGTFFGVGFAGAAAIIPFLSGPNIVFLAHGALGLILMAALWPMLPRGVARGEWSGHILARHIEIYSSPRLVAPAIGFLWHTIVFLGILTFLPTFLGVWSAPLLPLVALIGTIGAGFLARRFEPRFILLAGFALTILGFLISIVLPIEARVWLMFPLLGIIGLVPGASFANVPALNPKPVDQARANGAIAQLGNIGTAASVPVFAAATAMGFAGLATAAIVISAVGFGAVWLIHRKIAKTA